MSNSQTGECLYSVMVWIKSEREQEWLSWMQEHHVQAVVNQPGFLRVSMTQLTDGPVLTDDEATYRMDYWTQDMVAIEVYVAGAAKQLRQDLIDTFGSDARAERVMGTCVATFSHQVSATLG